jgi:integrase
LAPKTVRNVHVMLHKALQDAVAWHYIAENVASHAKLPRAGRRRPSVWSPEQLATFLFRQREDRLYALYLLAATTGMRRSELCGLRWSALDLESGTVTVSDTRVVVRGHAVEGDGKTDHSVRVLALDPTTVAALRAHRNTQTEEKAAFGPGYQEGGHVFAWEDGRPVHPDTIRQRHGRAVEAAGLPHIRLHDMRHTYATAALQAGISPKVISARLGHASVAFTLSTYTHALPAMDRMAADTVAALILGRPVPEGSAE